MEARRVAQLTLHDQAAANAFVAKVKSGKSFTAAAGEAGFAAGDIVQAEGTRDEVARKVVPDIAAAAFKAAQGAMVGPIHSPLGWHVGRVEKVTVSAGKSLAAAGRDSAARTRVWCVSRGGPRGERRGGARAVLPPRCPAVGDKARRAARGRPPPPARGGLPAPPPKAQAPIENSPVALPFHN